MTKKLSYGVGYIKRSQREIGVIPQQISRGIGLGARPSPHRTKSQDKRWGFEQQTTRERFRDFFSKVSTDHATEDNHNSQDN